MKYIFIAGLIGWLLGMSMKNIRLAALGIPTLYGLIGGFFFSRWAEQNHVVAYGIAYGLYALVVLIWLLAFLGGTLAGAIWGAIPGLFKALLNINEVLACIMTNWIAANLVTTSYRTAPLRDMNLTLKAHIL